MRIYVPVINRKQGNAYSLIFSILLVVCVFVDPAIRVLSPLKNFDELLALLVVPLFFMNLARNNFRYSFSKDSVAFLCILFLFMTTGLISTAMNHYQPMKNVFKDAYCLLKFFMAIGTGYYLFLRADLDRMLKHVFPLLNMVTGFLFILCLLDLVLHIFPGGTRYGLRAVVLMYQTYTTLVATGIFIAAIYLKLYQYYKIKVFPGLAMISVVIGCTLRTKAIAMVGVGVILFFYVCVRKRKPNIIIWIGLFAGSFAVAARQLYYYFNVLADESARYVLTAGSFQIAKDYFPFGTGWATYGSAFSADPYSKVYYMYRINNVFGLSPQYSSFISDTFWPMILGEHGVIGLVLYVVLILILFKQIYSWARINAYTFCSGLCCFVYLLISSTSESAFVNALAVPLAFWIGIMFADIRRQKFEKGWNYE